MEIVGDRLVYSATDLVGFLECGHLTNLERAVASGRLDRPDRNDPVLDRIAQRGLQHEERFLESLLSDGFEVAQIEADSETPFAERLAKGRVATLEAMRTGVDVVYQAVLFDGRRLGYADFLRRVKRRSDLGEWSYEVWDTKLARHAKASAILQLCMYSNLLNDLQGCEPEEMHLALGGATGGTVSFRVKDYAAYYRMIAREFEEVHNGTPVFPLSTDPEPVEHCGVCRWNLRCIAQWRAEDDLLLVANLTSRQRQALRDTGVTTRAALAESIQNLPETLDGIGRDALRKIQAQASIQVRGEEAGEVISERVSPPRDRDGNPIPNHGLLALPEPSSGDLFFDIEGDPFFGTDELDGIEYLFGIIEPGRRDEGGQPLFHSFWSIEGGTVTTSGERRAFEAFIDLVMDRLDADPNLHIYHYAPYEPSAVKRLAGRYGTREEEVDQLLRGDVFVDLYRAVRQGVRASVESYSIKRLEPLYGYGRTIDLRDAGTSIVEFETWLELGQGDEREDLLRRIEEYNRDDCISTLRLRDWLEGQRAELADELGYDLVRPGALEMDDREDSDAQKAVNDLVDALILGLPDAVEQMGNVDRGQWLLGQLLNWHRRESKAFWWRYFHLANELTDEERLEDRDALANLTFVSHRPDPAPRARSTIYRFRFPPQEHAVGLDSQPHDPETLSPVGTVVLLDDEQGVIEIKCGNSRPAPTAKSLIPFDLVRPTPKPQSLQRLAQWVLDHEIDGPGDFRAARDLLTRRLPRFREESGQDLLIPGEPPEEAARRLVPAIDESYLAIQGPPGTGKSTVGADMIVDLVERGSRVAVTANSHKVIGELLSKVAAAAAGRGVSTRIGQRANDAPAFEAAIHLKKNEAARDALAGGSVDVVGGTTWLWSREDMVGGVDYLFIDEAGQMSLADAVAASLCARNLVLLGDPQQLNQPLQGTHPPGAERSVLAHVLDGEGVMPDGFGIFLGSTWRLAPEISAYTSEVFYEGRLGSHPGRESIDLTGTPPLAGTGIRFLPVPHSSQTSESPEEANEVAELVRRLLESAPTYTDADGNTHILKETDVLLITPYNAQVRTLSEALPGFRIGTVDKFQGQEAPISIYSMATSSSADAPHGMEFLYSLNRLNVATSRARCLALVVASPGLLRVRCSTPRQMRLVNALARLVEMATPAS